MKSLLGFSKLRLRKFKELIKSNLGKIFSVNKMGEIRYGRNIFRYVFKPKFTHHLEFCINDLPLIYKITVKSCYTAEDIVDIAYSKFILGEYNIQDLGAGFKFNTIRNIFKNGFKSKEYLINHYSNKLSLPIIKLLQKEFVDRDVINIVVPVKISLMTVIREFETGIIDHVRKEFNLMRAGPVNIRSPLTLVA